MPIVSQHLDPIRNPNIYGIAIFWPLKRIPIFFATKLSSLTQKSKLVPILYIIIVFFTIPGLLIYLLG